MVFKKLLSKKAKHKKRLSPSATTPEGLVNAHPMYQYARNEFAQTVAPGTVNDDGKASVPLHTSNGNAADDEEQQRLRRRQQQQQQSDGGGPGISLQSSGLGGYQPGSQDSGIAASDSEHQSFPPLSPMRDDFSRPQGHNFPKRHPLGEATMPDATYEEHYGDAYVGGPIRYVYPSGYQSMRPRGGPWKLSIVIFVSFTWLSIFIIGHCSDRVDPNIYGQIQIDDDTLVIETRWCGSRLLYLMWVISMSITGLAMAYCSVIGYIKCRDFAVANGRSQPPGMVGKSDYYISLDEELPNDGSRSIPTEEYQRTIYQADGTPQFWGGHIYRPTQAAVAITSR